MNTTIDTQADNSTGKQALAANPAAPIGTLGVTPIRVTFAPEPALTIKVSETSLAIHNNSPATRIAHIPFKR